MKVKVTQEHIDKAVRAYKKPRKRTCNCCPIAQALNRKYDVTFDDKNAIVCPIKIHKTLAILPVQVKEFIRLFDSGKPVTPFEFEIDL